ncbi:MAG TPA: M73 family metallopeptidase [Candidatus Anaeromassilibacillus stercoravium]|nr:M73 family metallopeptidase [Candidatus Anaeromassilibacillus stercoravium]
MKANKKRIILSALSLVLVFCLLAGGTMAWFTDTEKVAGNFSAGILDIEVNPDPENENFTTTKPMEFKNLRPMLLKNFDKELVEYDEATETFADVNNLENNNQDPENYGDNLPIYFRPVRVENRGTLPIYIHLGMNATGKEDCTEPVLYGDNKYEIDQGLYKDKTCENTLEDALKIFVYKWVPNPDNEEEGEWERIENVNLNKETATSSEKICYDPTDVISAGEEVTYIIGGYLPSTAGNEYQGQHYHGALEVTAQQADLGPYPHNETGEDPAEFEVDVPITLVDVSARPNIVVGDPNNQPSIPMKFDKENLVNGSMEVSVTEVKWQIEKFLETYNYEGRYYGYDSYQPDTFTIKQNGDEYEVILREPYASVTVNVYPI